MNEHEARRQAVWSATEHREGDVAAGEFAFGAPAARSTRPTRSDQPSRFCGMCGVRNSNPGDICARCESTLRTSAYAPSGPTRPAELVRLDGLAPAQPPVLHAGTRKGRWVALVVVVIAILAGGAWVAVPNLELKSAMDEVRSADPDNVGVHVSVHYSNYMDRSKLMYDLRDVDGDVAPIDVFRVLLQFADKVQDKRFDEVVLAFRGASKFKLEGSYFKTLGEEYGLQNPVYTARTFPENVLTPSGTPAFDTWTGGILGVLGEQLDDFNEFHHQWYIDDLAGSP